MNLTKFIIFNFIMLIVGIQTFAQTDYNSVDQVTLSQLSLEELLNITITSATRYSQDITEAPADVLVITEGQITTRGYIDLQDVLRDVAGIDIVENAARFGSFYTIRGVDGNDRFLVLVDGHKLNPPGNSFLSIGNSIPVNMCRQIEIIFGPASAVYGADAFAGIINLVTKNSTGKTEAKLGVRYGSYNTFIGSLNSVIPISEDDDYLLINGAFYNSDGVDFTKLSSRYNIVNDYQSPLEAKFSQPINDYNILLKAKIDGIILTGMRQKFTHGNALGMNPQISYYTEANKWSFTNDLLWASYKHKIHDEGEIDFDITYANYKQDPETQFYKFAIPGNTGTTFNQWVTGIYSSLKGMITYNGIISEGWRVNAGVEYEYLSSIPAYANDEVLGNAFKYEGENAEIIERELTVREHRVGLFGQVSWQLNNNINLVAGARADLSDINDNSFNPRLGIIYKPFKETTLKLLFGTAFQAPSLFYKYEQFGTPQVAMISTRELGINLENQELRNIELNLIQKLSEDVLLNISVYHNSINNLITRVPLSDSVYNKYFNVMTSGVRNINIGKQKSFGIDIRVNTRLSDNVEAHMFYSYTDATLSYQGTRDLPRVSAHKIWLGLDYRSEYIIVTPRIKWVGGANRSVTNPNYSSSKTQPGYFIAYLNFTLQNFIPYVKVVGQLNNLFDTKILQPGLYGQSATYIDEIPQAGFNFNLGIELSL